MGRVTASVRQPPTVARAREWLVELVLSDPARFPGSSGDRNAWLEAVLDARELARKAPSLVSIDDLRAALANGVAILESNDDGTPYLTWLGSDDTEWFRALDSPRWHVGPSVRQPLDTVLEMGDISAHHRDVATEAWANRPEWAA